MRRFLQTCLCSSSLIVIAVLLADAGVAASSASSQLTMATGSRGIIANARKVCLGERLTPRPVATDSGRRLVEVVAAPTPLTWSEVAASILAADESSESTDGGSTHMGLASIGAPCPTPPCRRTREPLARPPVAGSLVAAGVRLNI
ncbi:MAG: hypothetical protein KDA44_05435 [Planctomycetales bacterium]|nr:hypothetical protein [Planctomycetales bacterium]